MCDQTNECLLTPEDFAALESPGSESIFMEKLWIPIEQNFRSHFFLRPDDHDSVLKKSSCTSYLSCADDANIIIACYLDELYDKAKRGLLLNSFDHENQTDVIQYLASALMAKRRALTYAGKIASDVVMHTFGMGSAEYIYENSRVANQTQEPESYISQIGEWMSMKIKINLHSDEKIAKVVETAITQTFKSIDSKDENHNRIKTHLESVIELKNPISDLESEIDEGRRELIGNIKKHCDYLSNHPRTEDKERNRRTARIDKYLSNIILRPLPATRLQKILGISNLNTSEVRIKRYIENLSNIMTIRN
jgi:hypothetical protein